jgi:N-sulfoglucosamine sulfohydrolase
LQAGCALLKLRFVPNFNVMKTQWLLAFCLLAQAFLLSAAEPKRNIILFVVDDQGLDAGCYGNPVIQTPNLDRLAREGTRFTAAFCTTASCSASRSVILSGLHNHATGQYGHQHDFHNFHSFESVRSLPVLLAEGGYRTARIGKFHVQPESVYQFQQTLAGNQGGARNPVSMAERSREFIGAKDDRPFFLYFCPSDPHRSGRYADHLPGKPNLFGNEGNYEGVKEIVYDPKEVIVPPFLPDSPECRAELAQYYQAVSRIDQGLGRLMQVLEETGQYHSTLIIFTSDNGIAFPGSKTTLYEPGMRLPLVIRSPDQKRRGTVCNAMVSWVDLTPTILDFAKMDPAGLFVEPPGAKRGSAAAKKPYLFHGRSFLSVLEQENPPGWNEIYGSHTFHEITMYYPVRLIRTAKYKYILNLAHQLPFPFASDLQASPTWQGVIRRGDVYYGQRRVQDYIHRPRHELYDLESDPHETINLADDPEYARTLATLQKKLREFQERTRDPWVVKYRYE